MADYNKTFCWVFVTVFLATVSVFFCAIDFSASVSGTVGPIGMKTIMEGVGAFGMTFGAGFFLHKGLMELESEYYKRKGMR